ncbi:hypothetical protein [Nonomuraea guangzhouensis]|uniref:SDR family oxidoreductase n=1 Tax=Nonomuraea guangzhouensis TaxID=1291555 RepID=A0ABW4FYL7_9ACTN|nr:hypothetical protein [Nonomuraea guangzhouensis]
MIIPGRTKTEQARKTFPAALPGTPRDTRALRRDQVPEDHVGTVDSSNADFITSQAVHVGGGMFIP